MEYKILSQLLQNPRIDDVELDLIIQTAIQIISGNRTTGSLIEVFRNTRNKHFNIILEAATDVQKDKTHYCL